MFKIAIIGYGKMGHEVERLLQEHDCTVGVIIDNESDWDIKWNQFIDCDGAIEFSTPETVISNISKSISIKMPIVVGTTGWYNRSDGVLNDCKSNGSSIIYGSNFSIGANIFFAITTELAKIMNHHHQYDCSIQETHHVTKKDAPSGTAITVAQKMIHELIRKDSWIPDSAPKDNQIPIISHRLGDAIGEHVVTFSSNEDTLSVIHHANNRSGLALGAVKAVKWLIENPGIYNFSDIYMQLK